MTRVCHYVIRILKRHIHSTFVQSSIEASLLYLDAGKRGSIILFVAVWGIFLAVSGKDDSKCPSKYWYHDNLRFMMAGCIISHRSCNILKSPWTSAGTGWLVNTCETCDDHATLWWSLWCCAYARRCSIADSAFNCKVQNQPCYTSPMLT